MDLIGGRDRAVGKAHGPGKVGGDPVGPVSRKQAAETPDSVGDREWSSGDARDEGAGDRLAPSDQENGHRTTYESTEPSEAHPTEIVGRELTALLGQVVQLGAEEAPRKPARVSE